MSILKILFLKSPNLILLLALVISLVAFFLFIFLLFLCIQRRKKRSLEIIELKDVEAKPSQLPQTKEKNNLELNNPVIRSSDVELAKFSLSKVSDLSLKVQDQRKSSSDLEKFDKMQDNVFQAVNSQYMAENLFNRVASSDPSNPETHKIYATHLNEISEKGIFVIAPVIQVSSGEDVRSLQIHNLDIHTNGNKFKARKKSFFSFKVSKTKKVKRVSNQKFEHNYDDECLRKKTLVMFNMSPYQQRHFLSFFGPNKNPLNLALKSFQMRLSKNKRDHIVMEKTKSETNSIGFSLSCDQLDNQIKSYLDNPKLSRPSVIRDSSGLGHEGLVKLRNLQYRHSLNTPHKLSSCCESHSLPDWQRNQISPEIKFSFYDVQKTNESAEIVKKKKFLSKVMTGSKVWQKKRNKNAANCLSSKEKFKNCEETTLF